MFFPIKQSRKLLYRILTRQIHLMTKSLNVKYAEVNFNNKKIGIVSGSKRNSPNLPGTAWNSNFLLAKEKIDDFMNYFPNIVNDLTEKDGRVVIPEIKTRYAELLHYVVPSGKKLRAFIAIATYELLEKPENLTPENVELAKIMGWILEIFQGTLIIIDDILDEGQLRRGDIPWHRRENVGSSACNDAFLLEQGVYTLLKKYFSKHHCYVPAMKLFHSVFFKTAMGQAFDTTDTKNGKPKLELFTMDRFHQVCQHKTGFCTFHLPISVAMFMANIYDPEEHENVKDLSKKLGFLYQIQDDFMDCFGDSTKSGKRGSDIAEGKCTWMAVMALQKANPLQRKIMEKYYGRRDPEAINIILNLFEDMNLANLYESCVNDIYKSIPEDVEKYIKNKQLQTIYIKIMKALYKRMR